MTLYFEDMQVGDRCELGGYTFNPRGNPRVRPQIRPPAVPQTARNQHREDVMTMIGLGIFRKRSCDS